MLVLPHFIVSFSIFQLLNTKKIGTVYVAHKRQVHWQAIHTVHNALYTVGHSALLLLLLRYSMYKLNSVGLVKVVLGQLLANPNLNPNAGNFWREKILLFSTNLDNCVCQDRLKICLGYVPDMSQIYHRYLPNMFPP